MPWRSVTNPCPAPVVDAVGRGAAPPDEGAAEGGGDGAVAVGEQDSITAVNSARSTSRTCFADRCLTAMGIGRLAEPG